MGKEQRKSEGKEERNGDRDGEVGEGEEEEG